MKNIYKHIYLCTIIIGLLSACTETNRVINSSQKPVIEAFLAPGTPISLKLSTVIGYTDASDAADTISRPIDGQTIQIKVSDGKIFTLQSLGDGIYTSAKNEVVKFGLTYTLDFIYKGLPVSATTIIPTRPTGFKLSKTIIYLSKIDLSSGGFRPPFGSEDRTPIEATWDNPNNEYHFLAFINTETTPEATVILPTTTTGQPFNRRFTNEPTSAKISLIQPQSFQYFGQHYAILYRLNADYAALYKSSGTTTQNISTPPTSITNGLGIFTGVNADTLMMNVYKL